MEPPRVKVSIPPAADLRYKAWAKLVRRVDASRKDGYAFEGPWLRRGRLDELPVGSLVLLYDEAGSRRYHSPSVQVLRVQPDGSLAVVEDAEGPLCARGWDWALLLRDRLAALLQQERESPLAHIPTTDLAHELAGREDGAEAYVSALLALLSEGQPAALASARALLAAQEDLARARDACAARLAQEPPEGRSPTPTPRCQVQRSQEQASRR
jgi:hypothetical protein